MQTKHHKLDLFADALLGSCWSQQCLRHCGRILSPFDTWVPTRARANKIGAEVCVGKPPPQNPWHSLRGGAEAEVANLAGLEGDLHESCDFTVQNFDARQKARNDEAGFCHILCRHVQCHSLRRSEHWMKFGNPSRLWKQRRSVPA